ncbi:MAG: PAS domain-containing sensor histidine kinase [Alphaproteobacteria bacterium]|nr:MAG: PAS domain-containing sensor histidine kinase [Alphaproteobacteria bacterium]
MNEINSQFSNLRNSALHRQWARILQWARRVRLRVKLEIVLAGISLLLATVTAIIFYGKAGPFDLAEGNFKILLLASIAFLLIFSGLIGHRVVGLFQQKKVGSGQLQGKIITYFGLMAVIPVIILAIFSALIIERGMQSWFSDRVRSTLNSSLEVAEAYIVEHRLTIQGDLLAMANDINRQSSLVATDQRLLQILVEDQVAKRALSEAFVFDSTGNVLAMARLNLGSAAPGVESAWVERAKSGEVVVVSDTSDDRVRAIVKLNFFLDTYLFISRYVDPAVLAHLQTARDSLAEYEALESERSGFQFNFNAVFMVVALLLLMGAIWIGFIFAGQLTNPIRKLAWAVEKVGQGDFKTRLPATSASDEIGILSRAFNKMTRQLESQQKDLKNTNRKLDERRRFSEAVLSGVSAGVIGLDRRGIITLPNRSACDFLGKSRKDLEGKKMLNIVPEFKPLLNRVLNEKEIGVVNQVVIERAGKKRTLLVRIAAEVEEGSGGGYVITFDDITDQLADQRTAAWADVAQRIAHEIKNPLTPIQLSAERLKRKYGKNLEGDATVFNQCTDTIIRQVGDLRRMVDEFSSFARMPKPVFKLENLTTIVRQAIFLQEVGAPTIDFKFTAPNTELKLYCDSRQISQAMTNLIKNAVDSIQEANAKGGKARNNKKSGTISIEIKPSEKRLEIFVRDTGPGLPEDMAERLMEPYVTTREKGTGLGLAIVRKIMEDHCGAILLENRTKNQGARVTLSFDLKALENRAKKLAKTQKNAKSRKQKSRIGVKTYGA